MHHQYDFDFGIYIVPCARCLTVSLGYIDLQAILPVIDYVLRIHERKRKEENRSKKFMSQFRKTADPESISEIKYNLLISKRFNYITIKMFEGRRLIL